MKLVRRYPVFRQSGAVAGVFLRRRRASALTALFLTAISLARAQELLPNPD